MSMQEEELRRRREEDASAAGGGLPGYAGIGGPNVAANQFQSFAAGAPQYSFSGLQGQGGLAAFLESMAQRPGRGRQPGPAGRNLASQGFDINFPGLDTQQGIGAPGGPIGGMNVAPGAPGGLAIGQTGQLPPGLAQQVADIPRSQGWRNLAPGYAVAAGAGFGRQDIRQPGVGGQRGVPPSGQGEVPAPGGNRQNVDPSFNVNRNVPDVGPLKGGGGPAQGTGEAPGGNVGPPGGGGTKPRPKGVTPQVKAQSAQQSTARGGTGQENMGISSTPGGSIKQQRENAKNTAYANAKAGSASGSFGDTIHVVPNSGNNNTPSETRPTTPPAPSASSFGKDERGTGTEPIKGKKKTATGGGKPTKGGLAARRA